MDFNDTKEEAEFRAEARAFLEKHLEPKGKQAGRRRGSGDEFMKKAKAWQALKADNKFAQITWPKEWGGRCGTPMQNVIWGQEEGKSDAPIGIWRIMDRMSGRCMPPWLPIDQTSRCSSAHARPSASSS